MADTEKQLRRSQESKSVRNEKVTQLMSRIEELHMKVQKIVQERKSFMVELQFKERECQLLLALKTNDDAHSAMLEGKLSTKRKKIKKLQEKLQRKECEIQSALQESKACAVGLSQVGEELKKKQKEVKQLQEEKEELARSSIDQKEQVNKLVQLTIRLTDDKSEMEVCITCNCI